MYYCNDLNSLSVLSLYEGELLGVVNRLYFDKKLKKLVSIELINDDGVALVLPVKNIYNVGKNAITVKNNQSVSFEIEQSNYVTCPIDSKAYSINGEYLGCVKEISFNEKFATEKISLDNNLTLSIADLASCGKNTIIFYNNKQKVNISKFTPNKAPKIFKTSTPIQTEILPEINTNKFAEPIEEKQTQIQNSGFLIGRICTKDILNFNNEILIKANKTITKKILKDISRFGKLRELMIFSK